MRCKTVAQRVRRCMEASRTPYKFFVGVPLSKGHELLAHNQGGHNTAEEKRVELDLIAEQDAHGDIRALSMRDAYMNLPNKLLGVLTYAYYVSGAAYLVVHDDDYCCDRRVRCPCKWRSFVLLSSASSRGIDY